MRNRILCFATVLALSCGLFAAPDPSGAYSVIKKIPIEGKGGWDYLPSTTSQGGCMSLTEQQQRFLTSIEANG